MVCSALWLRPPACLHAPPVCRSLPACLPACLSVCLSLFSLIFSLILSTPRVWPSPGRSFKTLWDVADWDAIPELGAAVKMDIEGGEWAVFDSAQRGGKFDTIMSKIALLDMEIHFCKTEFGYGNQTKMRKSIKMNLARLKRTFFIVGRWQVRSPNHRRHRCAGCGRGRRCWPPASKPGFVNAGTSAADRLSSSLTLPVFPCRCGHGAFLCCVRARAGQPRDNGVRPGRL